METLPEEEDELAPDEVGPPGPTGVEEEEVGMETLPEEEDELAPDEVGLPGPTGVEEEAVSMETLPFRPCLSMEEADDDDYVDCTVVSWEDSSCDSEEVEYVPFQLQQTSKAPPPRPPLPLILPAPAAQCWNPYLPAPRPSMAASLSRPTTSAARLPPPTRLWMRSSPVEVSETVTPTPRPSRASGGSLMSPSQGQGSLPHWSRRG